MFFSEDLPALKTNEYCVELLDLATPQANLIKSKTSKEMQKIELIKSSNDKIFHFDAMSNMLVKLQKPDSTGAIREIPFTQE